MKPVSLILSLSGGGIRGLLSAVWLAELESRFGKPLWRACSMIAGTSTGAIQACCLASGRFAATDLVRFYKQHGPGIFHRDWLTKFRYLRGAKYDHAYLEERLREFLCDSAGRLLTLADGKKPLLCETFDVNIKRPISLSSWDYPTVTMADAARASSAAPTYFRPHVISLDNGDSSLCDGGLECNHPGADAYAWLRKQRPELSAGDVAVLSIGTGRRTRILSNADAQKMSLLGWAGEALAISMHTERTSNMLKAALGPRYVEIDCELIDGASDDMDDASPRNLEALEHLARGYVARNDAVFADALMLLGRAV